MAAGEIRRGQAEVKEVGRQEDFQEGRSTGIALLASMRSIWERAGTHSPPCGKRSGWPGSVLSRSGSRWEPMLLVMPKAGLRLRPNSKPGTPM